MLQGAKTPRYFLDTTKHYRIWVSDNPELFLPDENKLRFIRMRLKNPNAKLSLLYSSKYLSETAQAELQLFCQNLNIKPMDFDVEVVTLLKTDEDKKLYELARLEIEHTITQMGGNLGSASDCIRGIRGVIEALGHYSDFDVEIDCSTVQPVVEVKTPVVLNCGSVKVQPPYGAPIKTPVYNIDFIALTFDSDNVTQLHEHAINDLRKAQIQIIENYEKLHSDRFLKAITGLPSKIADIPRVLLILDGYFRNNGNPNIFDFRIYINNFDYSSLGVNVADGQMIKHLFYKDSVIKISGPDAYFALFGDLAKIRYTVDVTFTPKITPMVMPYLIYSRTYNTPPPMMLEPHIRILPETEWNNLNNKCAAYGLKEHNLHSYAMSGQSPEVFLTLLRSQSSNKPLTDKCEEIDVHCDQSWSMIGAQEQKDRSHKITASAVTIQHAFRKWKKAGKPNSVSGKRKAGELANVSDAGVNKKLKLD